MTICVALKVNDCLVFAADSAASIVDGNRAILNVYDHGNKVFNLRKGLPICAMTSGMGNFGPTSISTLAKDLRAELTDGKYKLDPAAYTIEDVAKAAHDFLFQQKFQALPDPKPQSGMNFWIGGYSAKADHPELWRVDIDKAASPGPVKLADTAVCGLWWSGQPELISRVVNGRSMGLAEALKTAGIPDATIPQLVAHIDQNCGAPLWHAAMPTGDAIELVDYLAEATKDYVRFSPGANTVGGATDIATVTKYEGFKWVRRKHYFDSVHNPMEQGHG